MILGRRYVLPFVFLATVGLLAALYVGGALLPLRRFLDLYLIYYDMPPFGDTYGITSAIVCERRGFETYLGNPCHYRPVGFVYPPIWKLLGLLPVTVAWTAPLALGFIAAFGAALWFLPPWQSRAGKVLALLTLISPATLMAINYGNNDLLLFAIVVAAVHALGQAGFWRPFGYGLLMFAGLLKYFPFAAMGWAAAERPRSLAALLAALALVLAGFVWLAGDQLPLSLASMVTMSAGTYVWGIKDVSVMAMELGLTGQGVGPAIRLALTVLLIVVAWRRSDRFAQAEVQTAVTPEQWRFLVVGSLIVVGAYVGNQNLVYRMIFLLLVLPGLDALRNLPVRVIREAPIVAVVLMYLFPVRVHLQSLFAANSQGEMLVTVAGIVLREVLWFSLAATLLGLALVHVRTGLKWLALPSRARDRAMPDLPQA